MDRKIRTAYEDGVIDVRLLARQSAAATIERYGTSDLMEICKRAGVIIERQHWPLVTIGECRRHPPLIRVNVAAIECIGKASLEISPARFERSIVAHELGHLVLVDCPDGAVGTFAENYAHNFAVELLRLSFVEQKHIRLAVRFLCAAAAHHHSAAETPIAWGPRTIHA